MNNNKPNSFLDLIFVKNMFTTNYDGILKMCYFKDFEWKIEEPIFQSFKRVKDVNFDDYEDSHTKLNKIKKASIFEIKTLDFGYLSNKEFEEMTNSLNFNYKIQS